MPQITVTPGGPDIADGTYPMYLKAFAGPRRFIPENGPNAGTEVSVYDWTFETSDGIELKESSSTASGPRSKLYSWLTAILGTPPATGQSIDTDSLLGRYVLGQIRRDPPETGWPKLVALMPMPATGLQQQFGQATGAPVQGPPPAVDPARPGEFVMPAAPPVPTSANPAGVGPAPEPDLPF